MSDAARLTCFARELRDNSTHAKRALWQVLGRLRSGFTRQLRIDPYIADFACRRARLVIELDGAQHVDSLRDSLRTAHLQADGWRVVRFWNHEVLGNPEGVVEAIIDAGTSRLPVGECFAAIGSRSGRVRRPRIREKEGHPRPLHEGVEGRRL